MIRTIEIIRSWRMSSRSIGIFVLLSCFSVVCAADAKSDFQQKFHAIRTMQATFIQAVEFKTRASTTSSGKMSLVRPGRFRWDTLKPIKQLVVADGSRLWIYDEDLEQVTVKKQASALQSAAGLFLSDNDDHLLQSFDVSTKKNGPITSFDLRSKSARADFKHVIFLFEDKTLRGMELFDALGQHTTVRFQNIKINTVLPNQTFKFVPPHGVDVIDEGDARD